MRYDMADWDKGKDYLIARLGAGAWRHGIKTEAAMKEIVRGSRFPADPNTMLLPKWKKKNGDMQWFGLYYFTQRALKNEYVVLIGKSGDPYRVRRFYCVPHGKYKGEVDANGKPKPPPKEGLWLRREDLNSEDIYHLVSKYGDREKDSGPMKKYLRRAADEAAKHSDDITLADIDDAILDDL